MSNAPEKLTFKYCTECGTCPVQLCMCDIEDGECVGEVEYIRVDIHEWALKEANTLAEVSDEECVRLQAEVARLRSDITVEEALEQLAEGVGKKSRAYYRVAQEIARLREEIDNG